MLSLPQLQAVAHKSGARNIDIVEIDIIPTYLLQLMHERGLADLLAFKGGTMLRKTIFGSQGRLSTDLDFTNHSEKSIEELALDVAAAIESPYRGLEFDLNLDKDLYETEDGCGINPTCHHAANPTGLKVNIQISFRERPILPVKRIPQMAQPHFDILDFDPVEIPCLALEEVIAEKIRATCERSKIRDLYDLAEIGKREFDRDAVRLLAIWKLWRSGRVAMSFDLFAAQVSETADYDVNDLKQLLRKDQTPSLEALMRETISHFGFLERMTPEETAVVAKGREASPTVTKRLIETLKDWKELDPGFSVRTIGESWR